MKYFLFIICIASSFFGSSQNWTDEIPQDFNWYSYESESDFWINSGQAWHRYDGINVHSYHVSDTTSGLKGTFIQSNLYPDRNYTLWTSTYEFICYYDYAMDMFQCFKPIYKNDTLSEFKGLYFLEEQNSFLFQSDQNLYMIHTESMEVQLISSKETNNIVCALIDKEQHTMYTSPWVSGNGFEIWDMKKWMYSEIDFNRCSETFFNCTISDFEQINDDIWLASSKGLIRWNKEDECNSELFLPNDKSLSFINITSFEQHFLLTTNKDGLFIFNPETKSFISSIKTDHQQVPLRSNAVLDVFNKGSSFVLSFQDAPIQEIDKSSIRKEILLGESPETYSNTLLICSNDRYLCISDRNKYIHIFDTSFNKVCELDISSYEVIMDVKFIENDLVFASINSVHRLCLTNNNTIYNLKSEQNINRISTNDDQVFIIGAGFINNIYNQEFVDCTKDFIPNAIHLIQNSHCRVSTNTTSLSVENDKSQKSYDFPGFIQDIQFSEKEDEVIVLCAGDIYSLNLTKEEVTKCVLQSDQIKGIYVERGVIYYWDNLGVYKLIKINKSLKIIDLDDVHQFLKFGKSFIYTADKQLYTDPSKEMVSNKTFDLKVYSSNYELNKKNSNYFLTYAYYEKPVVISFSMGTVSANENGYYTYTNQYGQKQYATFDMPFPVSYFAEGKHVYSIQAFREDGLPANRFDLTVTVKGPFWKQWWFYAALAILVLSVFLIVFRLRIKRIQERFSVQKELNELEKSALQAQMNPHFIFNCLNSIQGFIMKNDKEKAMEYLGSFAQLIRSNLNASIERYIALDEEIKILKNYIKLEQLRLNDVFQFVINGLDDFEDEDVFIPPMLIQPFVENAIIHGMHGKEKEGVIQIDFSINDSFLFVNVHDNGDKITRPKKSNHKSVGVAITQKRLAHINTIQDKDFNVQFLTSQIGTSVKLKIRYVSKK